MPAQARFLVIGHICVATKGAPTMEQCRPSSAD